MFKAKSEHERAADLAADYRSAVLVFTLKSIMGSKSHDIWDEFPWHKATTGRAADPPQVIRSKFKAIIEEQKKRKGNG